MRKADHWIPWLRSSLLSLSDQKLPKRYESGDARGMGDNLSENRHEYQITAKELSLATYVKQLASALVLVKDAESRKASEFSYLQDKVDFTTH